MNGRPDSRTVIKVIKAIKAVEVIEMTKMTKMTNMTKVVETIESVEVEMVATTDDRIREEGLRGLARRG